MSKEKLGINSDQVHGILSKHILKDGMDIVFDFNKSKGCYVYDELTGNRYLDCFAQFASLPIGYNHPKLLAKSDLLKNSAECKIVNSDMYSTDMASFVQTLFDQTMPKEFTKAFFIEGGSNAVENALKIAFDYCAKKRGWRDDKAQNVDVVHLREAFHGRGGYTLSITNTSPDKTELFPRFNWTTVTNPKITFPIDESQVSFAEVSSLHEIERAMKKENVACLIMEVVQGEGGNNIFRKDYFQSVKALCDKYDCLLIFDEVQNGFGATGKWWSFENYGVTPDLFCFGKKSQVCGVAANMEKLSTIENNCFTTSSRINSTWGGNIIDMVRSKIIMDIIVEDNILDQVITVSDHFLGSLKELESNKISNVRGLGGLIAFDLPDTDQRNEMLSKLSSDMIILGCGPKSIRFRPALTFTKEHVDEALSYIKKAM